MDGNNLQIIGRTSLETESSSRDSLEPEGTISDNQIHYQQRLKLLYQAPQDLTHIASTSNLEERTIKEHTDNDNSYAYRLFASNRIKGPAEDTITTPKIRLDTPEPRSDAPRFVLPRRPNNSYFAGEARGSKAQQYQHAAVTAEDVLKYVAIKWTGSELPWRVQTIQAPKAICGPTVRNDPHSATRKRHGKKRRIVLRKRIIEAKECETKARIRGEGNAEAEKEKRNRKNRERKFKRRQKERDRKATERQGDG